MSLSGAAAVVPRPPGRPRPEPDDRADPGESPAVARPAVRRYVAATVAGSVCLVVAALVVVGGGVTARDWLVGLPLLVVGFVVAELASLEVEVRKGTVRLALNDLPMVCALLYAPVAVALPAVLVATVVRALTRRQHPVIAGFNSASGVYEVAIAYLVAHLCAGAGLPLPLAVLVAMVVAAVTSSAVVIGLGRVVSGQASLGDHLAVTAVTMTLVAPALSVSAVELVRAGPAGGVLLAGVAVAFAALYRSYSVLVRERKDLDLVQRISSVESDSDEVWPQVAELVRQQFNARRTVVRPPMSATLAVSGAALPEAATAAMGVVGAGGGPEVTSAVRWHADDPAAAEALALRGARDVLAVPLGVGPGAGTLELHDRDNQSRGFGPVEARLLETLSRHLSTAADNRRLLAQLRDDAYVDRLSGLRNRLGFTERAEHLLSRAAGSTSAHRRPPCAVLLADLDVLGQVNDALGHDWGDRLVALAAERVRAAAVDVAGPDVLLGRVDGDTFGVFLLGADHERAEEVAHQLAAALGRPYPMGDLSIEASPAIGVAGTSALHTDTATTVEQLVQQADVAMHGARSTGAPVRTYQDSMGQVFLRRFQLVTQFRAALSSGEVEVHYQPKLSLPGREVVGSEALVRWTHPEYGQVDPEELVRVLEATGLMDELTGFVLDRALARCRELSDRGVDVAPAVNVSVRNLLSPAFPGVVAAALGRHGLPPEKLTLEITETSVMGDAERTLPALRVLHEMGVVLSVDDFGTGYSSLSYLRRLPVDEVKIDKSFVLRMDTDLGDLAVVRAIIDLGRSLGLRVVAEGVETDVVRDQLAEMGCDVIQGYLVSRALEPARFDTWLHTRTALARETGVVGVPRPAR